MNAKKPKESNPVRKELENSLKKLIKVLDDESLVYLIGQAEIIRHNTEVDKINSNIAKLENKKRETKKDKIEIKADGDKKSFTIDFAGTRKFLTLDEMQKIVKICHSENDESLAAKRLFKWLFDERKDILLDLNVREAQNLLLKALVKTVRSKYKVKK
jgi:hypothetical protein